MASSSLVDTDVSGAEARRQDALDRYAIVDTDPEPVFDRLVEAAAALAGVPTALVSLSDHDRQWFKAVTGLDACSSERDVSFCDRVTRGRRELVVNDASTDSRFAGHPMVLGDPFVRFYVGIPLTTYDGHVLGSFCVVGYEPRHLDEVQMMGLRALASQVMAQLELRLALARESAARAEAAAVRNFLDRLLETAPAGVVACDETGALTVFNAAAKQFHGMGLRPDVGRDSWAENYSLFARDGLTPLRPEQVPLRRALDGHPVDGEVIVIAPAGRPAVTVRCDGRELRDEDGRRSGAMVVMTDVTAEMRIVGELRRAQALLVEQAYRDHLTGAANRRGWNERAPAALAVSRAEGQPACVAVLDLDFFKRVNDERGHAAGDDLLRSATEAWRSTIRSGDLLARLGGEEFAVLLPGLDIDDARPLVDRMRAALPGGLTASAGLTSVFGHETLDQAVARADGALYDAKAAGRDRCCVL